MKAAGNYILAIIETEKTMKGIIIGDKNKAIVHSVGQGVELDIKKGSTIWIVKNSGLTFGNYRVLDEHDVIAIGDDKDE